ncbi:light-mediated development protein DET1 isoform X8 [Typha angustifolia]|uniref:light-mediated development protein DET1 isoform X8 n=1 Tax=Typha angustifolia TaxID=59011 RepID=UPI003C303C08
MFRSNNVAARVFERQILTPRPGTSVNAARQFYENLCPSYTIYDIDCPDHSFRKFTDDGQYLVSFGQNHQDLIVYRPTWLSFSCKEEDCDSDNLPQKARRFDSFFSQLYCVSLASSNEFICKDFFLYMESHKFGLFATSTAQSHEAPDSEGAIHGVPSIEKITFYLVRLEDGVVLDEKSFHNDFVNLAHSMGAFLYEDLLCIVSLRYQTIHILQIRDSGNFVEVRNIGTFCREDDELFLHSHAQRVQHLKKKFYFHFQDYIDLIILKVQFLDRHHLLLKFGSVDGGVSRVSDQNLAFFAVYNMETTEIISFYQNSSEELYSLFEYYYDHFHANSRSSLHENFISSHSNNIHALDQLWNIKTKASSFSQGKLLVMPSDTASAIYSMTSEGKLNEFVKKMMTSLPYTCQSQSPSPYFDLSLFRYDEKLISATDRHRHSTEHPIKFISRRQPNVLKFKIKPGPETGGLDGRAKRISSFLFHPFLPFALSIQQTYMHPTVVNIHFRG